MSLSLVAPAVPVKEYVSCAETAVELRKALAANFPGVKFSVKSKTYSGGASITVGWTDGPTSDMVERISKDFAGATFDGMIDLKSYHTSEYQGRLIHWGADFVFSSRKHSEALINRACTYIEARYGLSPINRQTWYNDYRPTCSGASYRDDVSTQMHQILHKMRGDGVIVTVKR